MTDLKTTKDRIGERHPVIKMIAGAVLFAGLTTITLVSVVTVITNHVTAQKEYANAHAFQPIHYTHLN